jgi:hypothetical protein
VLRKLFSMRRSLTGAPALPRMKIYSASSGYVYHYFFEGRRDGSSIEYVFKISADRVNWRFIAIVLPKEVIARWQRDAARQLSASESYAIAKLAMFEGFDAHAVPETIPKATRVTRASLDAIAGTLGWD